MHGMAFGVTKKCSGYALDSPLLGTTIWRHNISMRNHGRCEAKSYWKQPLLSEGGIQIVCTSRPAAPLGG